MSSAFTLFFLFLFLFLNIATCGVQNNNFTFNGFGGAKLDLDGIASITPEGLLLLTNPTRMKTGHAFHPAPLRFKSPAGKSLSFSTTFVFAIVSNYSFITTNGMAFLISPTVNLSTAYPSQFLGLFNIENNCNVTNHVLAIELDTIQTPMFKDINNNHVGIDVNCLTSVYSHPAGYYADSTTDQFENLNLHSGEPMQVWVDFAGGDMQLNVTMSPLQMPKPSRPLLSATVNLSTLLYDQMYVGFSSATGSSNHPSHYVLGWSFMVNGEAESLDYRKLPQLPRSKSKSKPKHMVIWLPLTIFTFALMVAATVISVIRRRIKYAELLEDWEEEYGPHRFSYKELYRATDGFKDKELLGVGGFGRVYRGVLPASNIEVAVKRVSHKSGQGMKEFVAEIVSIGKLRHRNIVQLLGYCRRKGELLLVYDYMPNGSLDKYLYDQTRPGLDWARRFMIIKGVASGLLYLHEEWEQVVVHRDIKASNVLLDGELNAKLGDFGLARLCQHGTNLRTTRIIGTIGYLSPEFARKGKATTMSDVFAFGAFLLEVACGRRPLVVEAGGEQVFLVDWVLENWKAGTVLATRDQRLVGEEEHSMVEMEMVLKLGLLCSHPMPEARPNMRQVMQFLDGDKTLPDFSPAYMSFSYPSLMQNKGYDDDCSASLMQNKGYNDDCSVSIATMSNYSLEGR